MRYGGSVAEMIDKRRIGAGVVLIERYRSSRLVVRKPGMDEPVEA